MRITLDSGKQMDVEPDTTAKDLADQLGLKTPSQALLASVNGEEVDLSHKLKEGDSVSFLSFDSEKGKEVFWHTSSHVLAQAVLRLFPNAQVTIGPPIAMGFYYDFADLHISEADFPKIEKEMKRIIKEDHIAKRRIFQSKQEALSHFKHNPYKTELIQSFEEGIPLTGYQQGEFFDLCRGPHLYRLGKIKAIKLLKTSGAYWRGDAQKEMLTRIYGVSFPDKQLLKDYLTLLEESKKRDHRTLGTALDLFSMKPEAAGMPFIHPKGMRIWHSLTEYLRELLEQADYVEIKTPTLMSKELWEQSGHWANYRESMFTSEVEDREYAIKPMNCPGCMLFYKSHAHSYRSLPLRIAEIGHVHRFEPSGALSGLFRVRGFHQDDAHIFMRPDQIESEILGILEFADTLYSSFSLPYHLELSTKPEKNTIGTDKEWDNATKGLKNALDRWGHPYKINEGDGAFYGPKIDFHIQDAIGRTWQCGTIQLDMALPRKFTLEYTGRDGTRHRPVMLHRAIFGSIERFFGILIEHYAGKFPLWLSPEPARIVPVADRHNEYAKKMQKKLRSHGFFCDIDDANESVSKKIRNAQLGQVNYILTVGDQEVENKTVNVRTRDNQVHGETSLETLIQALLQEKKERSERSPFEG